MGKDDAAEALKLVKKLEQELKAYKKAQDAWEKQQTEWVQKVEKNLIDALTEQDKKLVKAHNDQGKTIVDMHSEQEKRIVELHNKQDKKFVDAFNTLKDWVNNTFDKKGLFD